MTDGTLAVCCRPEETFYGNNLSENIVIGWRSRVALHTPTSGGSPRVTPRKPVNRPRRPGSLWHDAYEKCTLHDCAPSNARRSPRRAILQTGERLFGDVGRFLSGGNARLHVPRLGFRERGEPLGLFVKIFGRVPETDRGYGQHAGEQGREDHRKGGDPRFVFFEKIVEASFYARVGLFGRGRGSRFMKNGVLKIALLACPAGLKRFRPAHRPEGQQQEAHQAQNPDAPLAER